MINNYKPAVFHDADGAGGAGTGVSAAAAGQQTNSGVKSADLSAVIYGKQETGTPAAAGQTSQTAEEERAARFKALIKGEYKDLYDNEVRGLIQKRFKATDDKVRQFDELSPVLERLYAKHGVKQGDIKALRAEIDNDSSYWEDEALEKGMTVEQLKEVRRMERENAQLKEQMSQQQSREQADKLYASWMEQSETTKAVYPSFDLKAEAQNPNFVNLLKSGIDVKTAFEVVHKDEILSNGMMYAVQQTEQKVSSTVAANKRRPTEGAMASQVGAIHKTDPSTFTKADRREIARRVARGERIVL